MAYTIDTNGLTSGVSDVVATAAMELPPLNNWYDADFLRQQTAHACNLVIQYLTEGMASEDRTGFRDATMGNDPLRGGALVAALLESHDDADARIQAALQKAQAEMKRTIRDEYSAFVKSISERN